MSHHILIVEDDELSKISLENRLKLYGVTHAVSCKSEALAALKNRKFDLAFIDLDLESQLDGIKVIELASKSNVYPIVLSGREDDSSIALAYEKGCADYLAKPISEDSIEIILKKYELVSDKENLNHFIANEYITQDQQIIKILNSLVEITLTNRPVLITGPTGVGKSRLAKLIHRKLEKNEGTPFVHLNCSELSETLLEAELFGYEKGAFTGAMSSKKGRIELADGGTLFLDEIGTMPISVQEKLLRAIEEKEFTPLGSEEVRKSNFKLISATCDDLEELIQSGKFRKDFYYRIEGHNFHIPALSERRGDIALLMKFFLSKLRRRIVFNEEAKNLFLNYSWPGNIREMEKTIDLLGAKSKGLIEKEDLIFLESQTDRSASSDLVELAKRVGLKEAIEAAEIDIIKSILSENDQKIRKTKDILKISNSTFYRIQERVKASDRE